MREGRLSPDPRFARSRHLAIFHSPLFRKLLVSAFFLIAATLLVLDFYLTSYIGERETRGVQQRLIAETRILSGEAPAIAPAKLEDWAKRVSARAQARITVI